MKKIIYSIVFVNLIFASCKKLEKISEAQFSTTSNSVELSQFAQIKFINLAPVTFNTANVNGQFGGLLISYNGDSIVNRGLSSPNTMAYSTALQTGSNQFPLVAGNESSYYLAKPGPATVSVNCRTATPQVGFPFSFNLNTVAGKKYSVIFTDSSAIFPWATGPARVLTFEDTPDADVTDTSKYNIRFIHAFHNDTVQGFKNGNIQAIDVISRRFGKIVSNLKFGERSPNISLPNSGYGGILTDTLEVYRSNTANPYAIAPYIYGVTNPSNTFLIRYTYSGFKGRSQVFVYRGTTGALQNLVATATNPIVVPATVTTSFTPFFYFTK